MTRPRTVVFPPVMKSPRPASPLPFSSMIGVPAGTAPRGWVVPSIVVAWLISGSGLNGMIVCCPPSPMLKTIVSGGPGSLDSMIACRSEPGPLSFVLVTTILRPIAVTVVVSDAALSNGSVSAPSLVTPVANWSVPPLIGRNRKVKMALAFGPCAGNVQV